MRNKKKNSAQRVGSALLDIIDNCIQNITDIKQKLSVFEHACSGFKRVSSEAQLPVTPSQEDLAKGFLVNTSLYLYVGAGGNAVNGRYFNVGDIRGPQGEPGSKGETGNTGPTGEKGEQGNSGVTGDTSDIVVINNLDGGESEEGSIKVLAAEQGKVLNKKFTELEQYIKKSFGSYKIEELGITKDGYVILSSSNIANITELEGYKIIETEAKVGDILSVYGLGAGNGQVFMISKKRTDNRYECIIKEKEYTDRYYSYVVKEEGTYALCSWKQIIGVKIPSTTFELLLNEVYNEQKQIKKKQTSFNSYIYTSTGHNKKNVLKKSNGNLAYDDGFSKYSVTDYIPLDEIMGAIVKNAEQYILADIAPMAVYDKDYNFIKSIYKEDFGEEETPVDIEITKELISSQDAEYIRFCINSDFGTYIENYSTKRLYSEIDGIVSSINFINNPVLSIEKSILNNKGNFSFNESFKEYKCHEIQNINIMIGYTIKGLLSWTSANIYPMALFDSNNDFIEVYSPAINGEEQSVDIDINEDFISKYPNAKKVRIGSKTTFGFNIVKTENSNKKIDFVLSHFSDIICCGDSTTEGFVVEDSTDNQENIYEVISKYSYPTHLGRLIPKQNVTTAAKSGITATKWLSDYYPKYTFSNYDVAIFELGLNGYLNVEDIDKEGTNTNDYKKIIEGVRNQNKELGIFLVRSQYYSSDWLPVLEKIAETYDCHIIDLTIPYDGINLASEKYHGHQPSPNETKYDYAHFTRWGYCVKSWVIYNKLIEILNKKYNI